MLFARVLLSTFPTFFCRHGGQECDGWIAARLFDSVQADRVVTFSGTAEITFGEMQSIKTGLFAVYET